MSYEINIYNPKGLNQRAYIYINIDGKRIKEYNGNKIGVDIKPNLAKTVRKRASLLNELSFAFKNAINQGIYPVIFIDKIQNSTSMLLKEAYKQKELLGLNRKYLKSLKSILNSFLSFLTEEEREGQIVEINRNRIQDFLLQYNSSNTHYMNQRRNLNVLFSQVANQFEVPVPDIKKTNRLKIKPNLHKIYSDEQIKKVLQYLKLNHFNLYLCCLISYGCLLRPHKEVRNLTLGHFYNDYTEILLSSKENKSGRIRVVNIPDYVRIEVLPLIRKETDSINLFSGTNIPFNEYYFSTAWKRMWTGMFKLGIIENNQTIYSFRHTAAVKVYNKTKDLYLLQQLMGHSDMIVTWAILSEVPYDLAIYGKLVDWSSQNIFFTLFFGVLLLKLFTSKIGLLLKGLAFLSITLISVLFLFDYLYIGIMQITFFFLFRKRIVLKTISVGCLNLIGFGKLSIQAYSFLGLIPILLYNGKLGRKTGDIFYSFYAIHLLLFGIVKYYLKH